MEHRIDCAADLRCELGESPVWDRTRDTVLLVDIPRHAIHAVGSQGAVSTWFMPSAVSAIGLCTDDRHWVVALRDGVFVFDPETERLDLLASMETDKRDNRLNDGKVGPDGAFWVGSMNERMPKQRTGSLYRVAVDGSVAKFREDIAVSNGLAWSPDGKTMFHADSDCHQIDIYDFDAHIGGASNRRAFARVEPGYPDGGATDINGCYWSCTVAAGCINRFAQDGRLAETIPVPVPSPTAPCFGGPHMRTLFFTSLRERQDEDAGASPSASGALFRMEVDVAGTAVARFRL